MLLTHSKFIVKSQGKLLSSKKTYEILDGETGEALGTGKHVTGLIASLLGGVRIDVRDPANNLVFAVARSGLLFKKDQVLDAGGVVGRYKSKRFSLSGGFHIYDKDGKHVGEIQGKMFKAEYKILTPDKQEIGSVTRKLGGLGGIAKSLLTGGESYAVVIDPRFAGDEVSKKLVLGATIAIESIFKQKSKGGEAKGGGDDGGDE